MSSASLALPSPTLIRGTTRSFHRTPPRTISLFPHHHHHRHHHAFKASSSSQESMMMEYDLYEILGIEKGADEREIKKAYRSLQKRCHPDIAGKSGHEMAIILNEIYALLSNPLSRSAYDLELAKTEELKGYTGRPMYSSWMGPETEERAVFVDEVRCVGCLKCALIADKTFAIESVYGRARVVAQWADTESKIQESIDACPVNCILMVERSELAGLEFLMSKQPRGNVRVGAGNTAGARVFDVFSEVKVLKKRLLRAMDQNSNQDSKYSTLHSEARNSAIQAIRSISNWFYWQTPTSSTSLSLTLHERKTSQNDPNIAKLKELASRGRDILKPQKTPEKTINEEYWSPLTSAPPLKPKEASSDSRPKIKIRTPSNQDAKGVSVKSQRNPFVSGFPIGLSIVAMVGVRLYAVGEAGASLEEHIGGSGALEVVNSWWLQVILAGATWYIVGMALSQLVDGIIVNRGKIR